MSNSVISTHENESAYFRGYQYEYVTIVMEGDRYFLLGKRRYGCVDKLELTEKELNSYL